ncbi:MAG TPA: DUF6624 domain-containing protein [Puia sp.]|nr:DUF6624 domain-containing protein [Puia sp.]
MASFAPAMGARIAMLCGDTASRPTVYDTVALELRVIDYADQRYRLQMDDTSRKYGYNSKQVKGLFKKMAMVDSMNLRKVDSLINKYGWLGPDQVGSDGDATIFAVIQHSSLKSQEKYLPLMREAVKDGKAKANHLALLEDRVALGEGRKQIYGSQLSFPGYAVLPLENPDSVDIRRASVGLEPLGVYLKECCNIDTVKFAPLPSGSAPSPARK